MGMKIFFLLFEKNIFISVLLESNEFNRVGPQGISMRCYDIRRAS